MTPTSTDLNLMAEDSLREASHRAQADERGRGRAPRAKGLLPGHDLADDFLGDSIVVPRILPSPSDQAWFELLATWPWPRCGTPTLTSTTQPSLRFPPITTAATALVSASPPNNHHRHAHPLPLSPSSSAPVSLSDASPSLVDAAPQAPVRAMNRFRRRGRIVKLTNIVPRPPMPKPRQNADGKLVLACPLPDDICNFVQENWRRPIDMARHLDAHFPPTPGKSPYRCVGCPARRFPQDVFGALPRGLDVVRTVGDVDYVGGCGKEFGRADSLKKHLKQRLCVSEKSCPQLWPDDDDDVSMS